MKWLARVLVALALLATADVAVAGIIPAPAPAPTQTLGSKLRLNAAQSFDNNPAVNPPWTLPAAWAQSTSYQTGAVVLNAGNLYDQVNSACTSAGSGGGPSAANSTSITDNTCAWFYMGQSPIPSNDAGAPTVTFVNAGLPFSGAVAYAPLTFPSLYKVYGATPSQVTGTNFWKFTSFNSGSGNASGYGQKACADVTDSKFGVGGTNTSPFFTVTIDGRYYSPGVFTSNAGTPNWQVFDFSSTSGYRKRFVCQQSTKQNSNFAGIYTTGAGFVSYPAVTNEIKAAFLYDSYDAGSSEGPFESQGTLGNVVSNMLGWSYQPMGVGGTGVQTTISGCGGTCYNYSQRAQDATNAAILATMNVIVFNSSTNDPTLGQAAAITALLGVLRADAPHALLIGIGPAPLSSQYSTDQALDTAGATGFANFVDPAGPGMACYVPFTNALVSAYTGTYMTGAPSNSNSVGTLLSNGDSTHPTDLGTLNIGKWIAEQIATQCLPKVARLIGPDIAMLAANAEMFLPYRRAR